MSLTKTSGRLTPWRLRLAEYDCTIQYRSGRVHQVPQALTRITSPGISGGPGPFINVDEDIAIFDAQNTLRDVSNEIEGNVCTVS